MPKHHVVPAGGASSTSAAAHTVAPLSQDSTCFVPDDVLLGLFYGLISPRSLRRIRSERGVAYSKSLGRNSGRPCDLKRLLEQGLVGNTRAGRAYREQLKAKKSETKNVEPPLGNPK